MIDDKHNILPSLAYTAINSAELLALHLRTIEALALAIEAKDHTTHQHLRRVQVYAMEIAKELDLKREQLEALRAAALLHDIGKLAVPEHIISKPGKLTREEFEKMKIHPLVGSEILEYARFPYPVAPIVRSHHERWDGTGYPDQLKGSEIPIGARILAVVDCFDALASSRQYRRALPLNEAVSRIAAEAGKAFDPQVVKILERDYPRLEALTRDTLGSLHGETEKFLTSIAAARHEVQNLFELAQDLGNSLSLNETLSLFAIRLKRMFQFDALVLYRLHGQTLQAEYVNGENFRMFSELAIPLGSGISGWVAEKRKPIVNGDPALEPGYIKDEKRFATMRSALAVPLMGLNGMVCVLTAYSVEQRVFTNDDLRILQAIVPKLALSVENAIRFRHIETIAATDYMTGLPNVASLFPHLDGELARCRRLDTPLVVMICDVLNIEMVHQRYGRAEAQKLLAAVAAKLKDFCGDRDFVARVTGEQFVLVLPGMGSDQARERIERLQSLAIALGTESPGAETLAMRVGYASFPRDGANADEILSEADRRRQTANVLRVTCRMKETDCERPLRVFLCHASPDKAQVRDLSRRLGADGAEAWLDEEKLLPGQDWRSEIRCAVRQSDAVLVCLSARSVTREGFVQSEIKYALDVATEKPDGTIFIIPVLLESCEVPERLRHMQWVSKADPGWYLQLSKALAFRAQSLHSP